MPLPLPAAPFSLFGARSAPAPAPERKGGARIALQSLPEPLWGPLSGEALARDGYLSNPVAYRCARLVAEAAASVPLRTKHERLAALLARPRPGLDGVSLLEGLFTHVQLSGEAFLEGAVLPGETAPAALYLLDPASVRPEPGQRGWAERWVHSDGARRRVLAPRADGWTPLFRLALFNPADPSRGLSPLRPARRALDLHGGAADWAKALMDNSARPSGALVFGGDASVDDDTFERLRGELDRLHSGRRNAGRPLLLEGGLSWTPMGLSPKEMDFGEARRDAAREIALAFGVPPMLLGIPGDNTYSNYREANLAFWRQTALPLALKAARGLSAWLGPVFGGAAVSADLDAVPALAPDRDAAWKRVGAAEFLTAAEKREALGLPPLEGEAQTGVEAQPAPAPAPAPAPGAAA